MAGLLLVESWYVIAVVRVYKIWQRGFRYAQQQIINP